MDQIVPCRPGAAPKISALGGYQLPVRAPAVGTQWLSWTWRPLQEALNVGASDQFLLFQSAERCKSSEACGWNCLR